MLKIFVLLFLVSPSIQAAPTTIAHRGASGYLPEHTLAGVAMAHSWGVDYIEPDIVMTKDSQLIVMHDIWLEGTTNVASVFPKRNRDDGRYYVLDFTYAEILQLNVRSRVEGQESKVVYEKRFPLDKGRFQVPLFSEFIELIQGLNFSTNKNIGIYPEVKGAWFHQKFGKDITKAVAQMLEDYGYNSKDANIMVQSFEQAVLKRLKNEFKVKYPLVQLVAENSWQLSPNDDYTAMQTQAGLKSVSQYAKGVGVWFNQITTVEAGKRSISSIVKDAHDSKLLVHVYTLRKDDLPKGFDNFRGLIQFVEAQKVDGWFTDFGDLAIRYSNSAKTE